MKQRLLGFFSGFPSRRFPAEVAEALGKALACRESLVFVSAWPEDYERNDSDCAGMYGMFLEYGLSFARHTVVDQRMEAARAAALVREASCVFLMGGHPGQQRQLLHRLGLDPVLRDFSGVVLGVSAGALNMARRSLDTKDSPHPYPGLGLADLTVKPHFDPKDRRLTEELQEISHQLPICAMEDNSAVFVTEARVFHMGRLHWVDKGKIEEVPQEGELPLCSR